jgi:hypothetical protein
MHTDRQPIISIRYTLYMINALFIYDFDIALYYLYHCMCCIPIIALMYNPKSRQPPSSAPRTADSTIPAWRVLRQSLATNPTGFQSSRSNYHAHSSNSVTLHDQFHIPYSLSVIRRPSYNSMGFQPKLHAYHIDVNRSCPQLHPHLCPWGWCWKIYDRVGDLQPLIRLVPLHCRNFLKLW